jgi:general secretion pathway protein M
MSGLMTWWNGREPRERMLLSVLAVVASLFALVFLLVLPLQSASARADAALERARADRLAVSRLPSTTQAAGQARSAFDRTALVGTARARNVRLTRVQPDADGSLSVWIDDTQTAALYGFFEDLLGSYDATLERVIISADGNGQLSAQFVVR